MRFTIFCLFVLFGGSLCSPSANQYVDNILHTTLQSVINNEKIDPTHLPDFTFEYTDKTFFGKVHGNAKYTKGSLSGLAKVARASECQGPSNTAAGTVVSCTLSFNYLKTSSKGKVKYGVLPKATITAEAVVSPTLVNVDIVKAPNQATPKVQTFGLLQIGKLTSKFTGLGPLNKQLRVLEENYRSRVATEMTNIILTRFQYALNLAVEQVPMAVQ